MFAATNAWQSSDVAISKVVQYAAPKAEVKAEPTLPTDPAAKQRAIDEELDRAIKRPIDVELNRPRKPDGDSNLPPCGGVLLTTQ